MSLSRQVLELAAALPQVLDTLDRLRVPATFYLVGERLQRYAGLVTVSQLLSAQRPGA